MNQWEYKTVRSVVSSSIEEFDEYLNSIGQEGWECYHISGGTEYDSITGTYQMDHAVFFKRVKKV